MAEKRTSILGRTRKAFRNPDAAVAAAPQGGKEPAKPQKQGGTEEIAAAVALAIDRGRRASRPPVPAFKVAGRDGPDPWATSGRFAQVNRAPARDPWNR